MKKLFLILCLVALVTAPAFAQNHPTDIGWVLEDSTGLALWTIDVGNDADTSLWFNVFRMPETGLGFHFYWNDADTGTIVVFLQQSSLLYDLGFYSDSAAAVYEIEAWETVDSTHLYDASNRGGYVWNPTLTGPAERARIIARRNSGTAVREFTVARIRQY